METDELTKFNDNIELKVINSVCQNKDITSLMGASVDDMFGGYGEVWEFLKTYYIKHKAIPDSTILAERFDYFEPVEAPGETAYYVDALREKYVNSRLKEISSKMRANTGKMASAEVLQKGLGALMKLNQYTTGAKDLDITDFDDAAEHYSEVRAKAIAMGGTPGIPTGIGFIDSAYPSGLAGGDLVIVLGWTGRMKSLITTMICCNAFNRGFKSMILSLEMSVQKVRDRAYTMMGKGMFRNSDLAMGDISEDDFRSWAKKINKGSGFVVVSHDGVGEVTPALVQSKIDQHKPSIVILDYAQLMSDNSNSQDMTARMRNMSREYKALAVANDIPIVLISSATPDSTASVNTPPIVEQVAWSKQLAFDADLAFAVHRHDGTLSDGSVIVEIAGRKNRNGDLFSGYFRANINLGIYEEYFDLESMSNL